MTAKSLRLLLEEHADLARLLDLLERQIVRIDAGEGLDFAVIRGILEYFLSFPDLCHHPKEDLVYRKLLARDGDAVEAVGDLLAEHERLAVITRKFATTAIHRIREDADLPNEWFRSMAGNFLNAYRTHMAQEEEIFFPAATETLQAEDWQEIDAMVCDETDPLFGANVERRYAALRREILAADEEKS